ncbi:zeta toxin family protein [Yinghuangia sp. ASG 101]|uniref:zeta toxin family protein n=1 Tax=Yinghuangia sp. ASG 101 TaxID=2896848 RepID=UPI001E327F01|nr:zeta toxin family protein [Yinghuangia sp. ASG 101]UGQ14992.1 zeta toxin family protein [Yinghuangia sp. ASG 101]
MKDYRLPPARNRQIFLNGIAPDLLDPLPRPEHPQLLVCMAQQGAGKTMLATHFGRTLPGPYAELDSDLFKPYHPDYDEIMRLDDREMARAIGPDGQAWMEQVLDYVREHKVDALRHSTAGSPEFEAENLRAFKDAGFGVHVRVLAAHEAQSRQGIYNRYNEQVRDSGQGRLTDPVKAERSYRCVPEAVQLIQARGLADRIDVVRRSDLINPVYEITRGPDGEWQQEQPDARGAVERERARELPPVEATDFVQTQQALRTPEKRIEQEMGQAWHAELDTIDALAQEVLPPHLMHEGPEHEGPELEM